MAESSTGKENITWNTYCCGLALVCVQLPHSIPIDAFYFRVPTVMVHTIIEYRHERWHPPAGQSCPQESNYTEAVFTMLVVGTYSTSAITNNSDLQSHSGIVELLLSLEMPKGALRFRIVP